jgi:CheY-like chemotaxis protein
MFRRVLGERIELNCEFAAEVPAIFADQTSVEQVVMNLLLNARDAMPRGGSITLGTGQYTLTETNGIHPPEAQPGSFAYFSVTDTGVGMDESTRAHIFEPFFTTKEVNKGTGMGLATVYGIARQHDGWIDVVTAPGEGSTFRVYFPVTDRILEPSQTRATVAAGSDRPHTILAVEDDSSVRSLVCEILEHHGYRVIEAESGDHAHALWPTVRDEVELLLTDMVMPGELNGLELAQKLVADKPDLKVIYTSGYSSELFSSDISLEEGRNYLPKPYFTAGIIQIVRKALETAEPVQAAK